MITRQAPAKINLGLEVLRRRPDGYHDINTIFATVDLFDRVVLRRVDGPEVTCSVVGDDRLAAEAGEENLCVRAARRLLEKVGLDVGVDMLLEKNIPTGAGLGGGSSDAAATLLGLRRLYDIDCSDEELREIGLELGSDIPFFIPGGLALGGGQGEVLTPIKLLLPWHIVLVNPGVHVPTPKAYGLVGRREERPSSDLVEVLRRGVTDPSLLADTLINDFQEPVFRTWPAIAERHERLASLPGVLYSAMSGSGSTLYGLFEERGAAEEAAGAFSSDWTHVGRFI